MLNKIFQYALVIVVCIAIGIASVYPSIKFLQAVE